MKYEQLAQNILQNIGGPKNIHSVFHCITRLRFQLKNEEIVHTEKMKNLDGVISVIESGGQYQVVIGNHVPEVYQTVLKVGGIQEENHAKEETKPSGNIFNRFIDMISGIFTPILGVMAATGMIKGFAAMFAAFHLISIDSGTYKILYGAGDSLFYFLPVFLGYTAAKKFVTSPFIGMAIGAALVYPSLDPTLSGLGTQKPLYILWSGTIFESPIHVTFLGIPVILMTYSTSVIPIILAVWFSSKVEKNLKKIVPDLVKTFLIPFFTLIIVVPIVFLIIGPIATWAGQLLGAFTLWLYGLSPLVAGILMGALWQVFVIFGLHWGLVPIAINNLTTLHYDPIIAMAFAASFAQIGVVLAMMIKTKNKKLKSLSVPAFISGIFGVTEPAIYGVTLPLKKPFILSCIAGGIGGGIIGFFNAHTYIMGGLGAFGIPNFIKPGAPLPGAFWWMIVAIIVAFIIGFLLTIVLEIKDKSTNPNVKKSTHSEKGLVTER